MGKNEQMWDYHPVQLPILVDLEVGSSGTKSPECVICFESIETVDDRERGIFSRWSYMVPPCHHIAHTRCLESWLAIKSEWSAPFFSVYRSFVEWFDADKCS